MTLPSPLVQKKFKTYLVWRHSDVISDVISKTRKSPKIAKIMVFHYFFKQKLHFLAMMCVKVCLHIFLLQINQINKIKHRGSVSWNTKKTKTRFVCNFNGKSVFRCTHHAIMQRRVITLGPIFIKMDLNRAQGLKEKSQEVSAQKITTGRDITKNVEGEADSVPPALLGLRFIHTSIALPCPNALTAQWLVASLQCSVTTKLIISTWKAWWVAPSCSRKYRYIGTALQCTHAMLV